MQATYHQLDRMRKAFADLRTKCGGEGSGRPGPCPGEGGGRKVRVTPEAQALAKSLLGDVEDLGAMIGAPPGFPVSVSVSKREPGTLEIDVNTDDVTMSRQFKKDANGKTVCVNVDFQVSKANQGKGLASQAFADQVAACRAAGVDRIVTKASGKPGGTTNGYYTWARMGYDGAIPESVAGAAKAKFGDVSRVSEIMQQPGGGEWWKANGASFAGAFSLQDGSLSVRLHETYMKERAARQPKSFQVEQGDLAAWEEAALAAAWRKVSRSSAAKVFADYIAKCGGPGSGIPGPCGAGTDANRLDAAAKLRRTAGQKVLAAGAKIGRFLKEKYLGIEQRYGRRGAIAMAGAFLVTFPVPGNSALIIGAAEGVRFLHARMGKGYEGELDIDALMEEFYSIAAELGLDAPEEEKLRAALAGAGQKSFAGVIADYVAKCGGEGSGRPGPCATGITARVAQHEPSEKAQRAIAAHVMVDKTIQRYSEEHNEPQLAKAIGGKPEPDNKEYDVLVKGTGKKQHGCELKTMVVGENDKVTMKRSAMERKAAWEKRTGGTFHTIIYDDRAVWNAKGKDKHDESKRVIYYRRGAGSFRVKSMHQVKDHAELKSLLVTPGNRLPAAAQATPQWRQMQGEA